MTAVFFLYGLAYFILGLTIAVYPKKHSEFRIAQHIWLIAAFGLLHGLTEWVDMFIILEKPFAVSSLRIIKFFSLPLSYVFLLQFGVKSITDAKPRYHALKAAPVIFPIIWAMIVISNSTHRVLMADIGARYVLGIPGIWLTSYALMLQSTEIKNLGRPRLIGYLRLSALGFFFYGFFSGVIVPEARFFPATILNYTVFGETVGLEVQVFRALTALLIAFGMIKVLEVFQWETTEVLRKSRENYRSIFDSANDAIFIHDVSTGAILDVNRKVTEMYGYTPEEMRRIDVAVLSQGSYPYNQEGAMEWITKAVKGEPQLFEWFAKDYTGRLFWVEVNLKRAVLGGKDHLLAIVRDISERKLAENALRHSFDLLKTVINSMNDAVSLIDVSTFRIVIVNRTFLKEYGYNDESEVVGKTCYEITHHKSEVCAPPNDICPLVETVRTGAHSVEEHIHYGKGGEPVFVEVSTSPIEDEQGNVVQVVHVQRNITERKITEEKLKRYAVELERSNKELEEFAYIASHDLQEPLRGVSGFAQRLSEKYKGKLDQKADEYISFIVSGATRMSDLIRALLTYSRVGSRQRPLEPVDCNSVLKKALENLKVGVEESGAVIESGPLPTVPIDEVQLIQLFQNMIGNSIKYRSGEQPRISIMAEQIEKSSVPIPHPVTGRDWLFMIKDNGIGIDPKYSERIFQIFQRLHGRDKYPGTGIGLALCKKIVEHHGGRLWVESETGSGSTFYFTIPG
jgi:PAS domain S-box-containing protein